MRSTVVVPIDGTEQARRAVPVAAWLARRGDGDLTLVRVVHDAASAVEADAELQACLASTGLRGRTVVTDDVDVPGAIVAEAGRVDGSVLCVATRRGHRLRAAAPSATTSVLLTRATTPMVIVGPACDVDGAPVTRMSACLDGSRHAERVLPVADELATRWDLALGLTEVVTTGSATASSRTANRYLDDLAGRLPGVSRRDVLHGGDPAQAIVAHCIDHPGTMPAIATRGRARAQLALRGSVALQVAHRCPAPTLVLPPRAASIPLPPGP